MSESIFIRIKRIVAGRVEDLVDAMEAAGGSLVMRQAIREVEQVMSEVASERDKATASRLQAVRQQKMYEERLGELQVKAEYAMAEDREDLAEAVVYRQLAFEQQMASLRRSEESAAAREKELEESFASLELRKAHMQEELEAFEMAHADTGADAGANAAYHAEQHKEHRVARAEKAFDRAMKGAGASSAVSGLDIEQTRKISELDALQKQATVADRLQALRAKASAA